MLKAAGGSGGINPHTGLREFDPSGSSGGPNGGSAGGDGNNGNNGGNAGGHASQGSGGYTGTHASGPGFGSGPTGSPSGGGGQYGSNGGYNGGITVNPGRSIASLGLGLIPGVGPILSGLNSAFGPTLGPSFNFGGTTNGYSINGDKTGVYGMGQGGNYAGHPGAVGGGQHDGSGGGIMGNGGQGGVGAPATLPGGAPGAGGLPPGGVTPPGSGGPLMGGNAQALLALMSQASPNLMGNRYGPMPSWATTPYQIGTVPAVNQPPRIPGTPFA